MRARMTVRSWFLGAALACAGCNATWWPEWALGEDPVTLGNERVLDAPVHADEASGLEAVHGELEDLLLDELSGTVVAAVLRFRGGGRDEVFVVEPEALAWDEGSARVLDLVPLASAMGAGANPFEGQEPTRLEGVIRTLERAGAGRLEIRLLDDDNLLHRVCIEPEPLVARRAPRLHIDQHVVVRAVETRDERGKLWIASALAEDGPELALRDASGRLLWLELAQGSLSARSLLGATLLTADGARATVHGWTVEWTTGTVRELTLSLGEGEKTCTLPWGRFARDAEGQWRTPLAASELAPAVAPPAPAPAPPTTRSTSMQQG